ncbi:hypothetical protein GRI42_13720 [Erythrobacter gaetbuli]|uniref:Type I restriction modification DNA specificity domain-containing protein n=1 Tax=Qipengyuania gaetbuli TaxID=266952 RepID=A0A844Y2V3_9SPHN|nr:restriction endonuclease subunit S [Qipengyuania gaetbuli]MXO52364.1 hypothetical protein [Qipengyuania gaetbuli]
MNVAQEAELPSFFEFIRNGMNVKQSKEKNGLPITRIETISHGEVDAQRVGYAGLSRAEVEKWLLKKGDILFSHINSVEHIGKCALFDGGYDLVHGMNLLCFRPKIDRVDPNFLKWFFRSSWFRSQIMPFVNKAVNQASISIGNLNSLRVTLPPLEEQKRIAAILNEADELRRKRQRAVDRLYQLGQAIFHDMFGDPERGYKAVRLGDVAAQIDYGLTASAQESGDGPKFLRITDIQDGKVDWGTVPVCAANTKQIVDNKLASGDIVFARTGATTGKSFLIEECPDRAVFASYLIRVRPSGAVRPEYLFGFFQTKLYWNQIKNMAQGAAQPGVNSTKLKELILPLPPVELQEKFCCAYRQIKSQLVTMEKEQALLDRLCSSLQHRAFKGEL